MVITTQASEHRFKTWLPQISSDEQSVATLCSETAPRPVAMETAKLKAVVAVLKSMSMKAGTYIRDASAKTADAVNEGTKSLRESKFGATAGETVSSIGTRAAEGGSYMYNVTKTTAQGVVGRLSAAGIPAECAREARCVSSGSCVRFIYIRDLQSAHPLFIAATANAGKHLVPEWFRCAAQRFVPAGSSARDCSRLQTTQKLPQNFTARWPAVTVRA